MKKLIFGIATGIILLTISLYPQSKLLLLMGDDGYKNAELKTYLASLTTPISSSYAKTLDTFISMVKDSLAIANLSDAFDVMYDLGGETAEQSLKNLVKRQHDATAVNSPTWTQWEGFTGNGTSSYLNTNYNPATQRVTYTQNSASYGAYLRTDAPTNNIRVMGWDTTGNINSFYVSPTANDGFSINSAAYVANGNATNKGMFIVTRVNSTQVSFCVNGSYLLQSSNSVALTIPVSRTFLIFNNYYSGAPYAGQLSFAFMGKGLSATEVRKLTNCVEWLMDSKGKGVIP